MSTLRVGLEADLDAALPQRPALEIVNDVLLDGMKTVGELFGSGLPRGRSGPSYEELVETEGRPRLRMWLERIQTEGLLEAAVVYGYFRRVSEGNDLIVLDPALERFTFPRQRRDRRLCLADFFKAADSGRTDVVAFQLATMGPRVSGATAELFAKNAYREYLELHPEQSADAIVVHHPEAKYFSV